MSWHAWEDTRASQNPDEDPYKLDEVESAAELAELLIDLKVSGCLSAKQCCVLAWWASRAGACGMVKQLAQHPLTQSGKFSKHFDRVVGIDAKSAYYNLELPGHRRCDASRSVELVPTNPPHEALTEEVELVGIDRMQELLRAAIREDHLPPAYYDNDIVKENPPGTVHPCIIYVDAVPFTRTDGALGFYCYNLLTQARILCAVLRKTELCACGCKGWCTFFQVFLMLHWSFEALRKGERPNTRHDRLPFHPFSDEKRIALAGQALPIKVCLLMIKADMAEYVHTFGFPAWNSLEYGCNCCASPKHELHNVTGIDYLTWPWPRLDAAAFELSCSSCELSRQVTADSWRLLRANLHYDKRTDSKAFRGRCLQADLPVLNLLKGDRLEPSQGLTDTGSNFDDLSWPQTFTFWRRSQETAVRHRNPLYNDDIGTSPDRTNSFDWLHCLSWGVFKDFLTWFVHELWAANVFRVPGTGDAIIMASTPVLKSQLFDWYRQEKLAGRTHTEVQDLVHTMFGTFSKPKLGLFASETNAFLLFSESLLARVGHMLPHSQRIQSCLTQLTRCYALIKQYPQVFPPHVCQEFLDCAKVHINKAKALGINLKPKHHFFLEMAWKAKFLGSPGLSACWTDETINRFLKMLSGHAHRRVWHRRVLDNFGVAYSFRSKRRRY